ncbi:cupin domain-containing protein [Phytohabitans flavus]
MASVFFAPGARTYWHSHEKGQILVVTAGSGLVCSAGGVPQLLHPGDTVWVPPGEAHWHGGGPETYLVHLAISLGQTGWRDAVTDDEYLARA